MKKKIPFKKERKTTSEKPVSLSPLDLKEALTGILGVKPEEEKEMTEDVCKKERMDLETAKDNLEKHQANPMDWDTSSESYQNKLAELKAEVIQREKILSDCEAKE